MLGFINIQYYRFVLAVTDREKVCELPQGEIIYKIKDVELVPFQKYEKMLENAQNHV